MNSAKHLISFLAFMLISLSTFSQSLTTLFAADNSFDGNMFDVTATNQISICAFDVNVTHPVGNEVNIAVYWKNGTHVGFDTDPSAWTLLGTETAISAGLNNPTEVFIGGLTIDAGNTVALYVTQDGPSLNQNSNFSMAYTNGTGVGNVAATNSDLTIFEGFGIGGIFQGTFFPRIWNGTIHYSLGGSSTLVDCYLDSDGDNFGDPNNPRIFCTACGEGYVLDNTDCDDSNAANNPGATEICDFMDNDCDGVIDEGFTIVNCYLDNDGDNFGDPDQPMAFCATCGPGYVTDNTDCDDSNPLIFPGAILSPVNTMGYQICPGGLVLPGEGLTAENPFPVLSSISSSPVLAIADNDPAGVSDIINAPQPFSVGGVTVDLQITHTWTGDLIGTLTAPDGSTSALLFDRPGKPESNFGCLGDDLSVTFDDNATLSANDFENTCNNLPAISGTYQPIEALSTFSGMNGQGDWTLTISDNAEFDLGTLDNWTLNFEGLEQISWWDAPTGGNQLATGGVFDPTSIPVANGGVDPDQAGVYPYWAQFDLFPACGTNVRVQVDFTVGFLPGQSLNVYYKDLDDDGYTDGSTITNCVPVPGYKLLSELANTLLTDCNDDDPYAYPGQTWIQDNDDDYFGNGITTTSCLRPAGYKAALELMGINNDCDDNDQTTNPDAKEICDGKDNDCNGLIDDGAPGGETFVGNVIFNSQAQLDAWPACYSKIEGTLTIMGGGINNLGPLSNITEVTGTVTITNNSMLTNLNGLENLATVGGNFFMYYNFLLVNCCAIDDLLTNGGIAGMIQIFYNSFSGHCGSAASIMAACPIPTPLVSSPNSEAVSIGDNISAANEKIQLFPNPASDEVNVMFDRTAPTATLRVVDMLGRIVFEQDLEEGIDRLNIDLNNEKFGNGIYLISIYEDGEMTTKQLLIQR